MARNRFQSVLEVFEEVRFFIFGRLSEGNNTDFVLCFGTDNENDYAFGEAPQCHEALFAKWKRSLHR